MEWISTISFFSFSFLGGNGGEEYKTSGHTVALTHKPLPVSIQLSFVVSILLPWKTWQKSWHSWTSDCVNWQDHSVIVYLHLEKLYSAHIIRSAYDVQTDCTVVYVSSVSKYCIS